MKYSVFTAEKSLYIVWALPNICFRTVIFFFFSAFLECYLERDLERDLLKFDLGVYRNQVPFNDVYFVNQTRHHLINGECPAFSGNPSAAVNEDFFQTSFYVDPSTNLITDGSECGIEVVCMAVISGHQKKNMSMQ